MFKTHVNKPGAKELALMARREELAQLNRVRSQIEAAKQKLAGRPLPAMKDEHGKTAQAGKVAKVRRR